MVIEQVRQFGSVEGSKDQNIAKLDEDEWKSACRRYLLIISFTLSIIPSASEFKEWFPNTTKSSDGFEQNPLDVGHRQNMTKCWTIIRA